MALPESVNTTYATGTKIKSADLNDIQTSIVGGKHGTKVKYIDASRGVPGSVGSANFVQGSGGGWEHASGTPAIYFDLGLHEGARIDALEVFGFESASDEYDVKIFERDLTDGSLTQVSTTKSSGTTNAWTSQEYTSSDTDIPKTLGADKSYVVEVTLTGANVKAAGVKVTYVQP